MSKTLLVENIIALYEKNNKPIPEELEQKLDKLDEQRKEYLQNLNPVLEKLGALHDLDEKQLAETIQEIRSDVINVFFVLLHFNISLL